MYFQYKHSYYAQVFGIAMGSPIAAPTDNLVMEHVENKF